MPPGDRVGEAYVDIHVNAGPGEAELAAFKAKVDRDFAELGRKRAEAELQLKSADFDKKIDEAKAKLDYFKMRRANATLDLAKKHFDEQIAAAKAELAALGKQRTTIRIDSSQLRAAHAAERLLAKERTLNERAALRQTQVEQRLSAERQRATTDAIRTRAEIAKLSETYEKLRGRQIALEKSSRRVFSSGSIAKAEAEARKLERVASEADYVKHRIEQLGGSVEHLDPQINRNSSLLDRWLSRLGDTSVRLGPITTSIKGLATGLGLLGPIIFELGGGLVSLVGTMGEGLAGAATVGAGALGGLAMSALGVGLVIKPMISEFGEAKKASEALYKAQLKYGKGSKEAQTYQERLNNTLKGVSPVAREAFEDYGSLKTQWKSLTKAARPAVFTAFGESLKTVQSLLPGFARESTKTTQVAGKAWDSWMKSLRSSEAKKLLNSVMADFRASIPGLTSGIGSLVAMIGRLGAAGAHFLPGLSHGFAVWANNLEHAVGGGQQLQSDVGRLVSQMQDFGHLTQHTGSLLVHIFDASANSGDGLVRSLDKVIQRWDKWTQSARGKAGLKEFFADSKTATEDFFSSLSHLTKLLFEFSRATAPVANGLLKIVTWIGDIVSAADGLVGVKQIFQGIGIVLAGLWVASKVLTYADAIGTVVARLGGLIGIESAAAAATEAEAVAAAEAATALEAETAAAASADVALGAGLAEGAAGAGAALEGTAASAGILAAALAPEVLIPVGIFAGLTALTLALRGSDRSIQDVEADFRKAGHVMNHSLDASANSIDKYVAAQHRNIAVSNDAAAARARLVKLQKENAPLNKVTKAVEALDAAEARQTRTAHQTGVVNREQITSQKHLLTGAKNRVAAAKELIHALSVQIKNDKEMQRMVAGGGDIGKHEDELAAARHKLATATKEVAAAQRQEAATAVPYERSLKNLKPISQAAEAGLRKLVDTIGSGATKKIGSFVDPRDVQRVAELGNRLTRLGRGAQVKNIAVKSQGADQTIAKLQRLQQQTNRVRAAQASIKIGANDTQAQSKLKRLSALSQRVVGAKNTIHILANSGSAEQAIHRLRAKLLGVAHAKYQAEIKALDKTTTPAEQAHHRLRQAVQEKYSARIEAVDNASAKAKKAEGAAKNAGKQRPNIHITATASQAMSEISRVQAGLSALHDKTVSINVVTHKSGGFSGGPAGAYYSTFAMGGVSDREIKRANEKATRKQSGPSRRITRPTMLVGEQAPQHPEYVIATNPAFRTDNERYLDQAAGDLGYEVVPAHKKGKGKKGKGKGGGGGAKSYPTPPSHQHRKRNYLKYDRFSKQAQAEYNLTEEDIQLLERQYNASADAQTRAIHAGRQENYNYAELRSFLNREKADYLHLNALTGTMKHDLNIVLNNVGKDLHGYLSPKSLRHVRKEIATLGHEEDHLKGDPKRAKAAQKRAAERHLSALEKERDKAIEIQKEAREKLNEITGRKGEIAAAERQVSIEEVETNEENFQLELEESLPEAGGAGAGGPTLGEQTAAYNEGRAQLFEQFASNIFGQVTPSIRGAGGGITGPSGIPSTSTGGKPNYFPTGGGKMTDLAHTQTSSDGTGKINVVNNFAAPPPDPHTWARQQEFELGALA